MSGVYSNPRIYTELNSVAVGKTKWGGGVGMGDQWVNQETGNWEIT